MISTAQLRTLRLLAEEPAYRFNRSPRQGDYTWVHCGDTPQRITRNLHRLFLSGHATVSKCRQKAVITEEGRRVMAQQRHQRATCRVMAQQRHQRATCRAL
jgi:hypothetical protein